MTFSLTERIRWRLIAWHIRRLQALCPHTARVGVVKGGAVPRRVYEDAGLFTGASKCNCCGKEFDDEPTGSD